MSTGRVRVEYQERQVLRVQELRDEQSYHADAHRRHLVGHHIWGVVCGMQIELKDGLLSVSPGMAVDGYGRSLVLGQPRFISPREFDLAQSEALDVWAIYEEVPSDPTAPDYADCGAETSYTRVCESVGLRFERATALDPRTPPGVPSGDLAFGPEREAVAPQTAWPVFLGTLRRDLSDADKPYTIEDRRRPSVGVRAARIEHPIATGQDFAKLTLGRSTDPDTGSFAVGLFAGDEKLPRLGIRRKEAAQAAGGSPSAEIDIRGSTQIRGDLTLDGGGVAFEARDPDRSAPEFPSWRIYRSPAAPGSGRARRSARTVPSRHELDQAEELRIEIGAGTSAGGVAIGFASPDDGSFQRVLTILRGVVIVDGDLRVGALEENGGGRSGGNFSDRVQAYIASSMLSGLNVAPQLLQVVAGALQRPSAERFDDAVAVLLASEGVPGIWKRLSSRLDATQKAQLEQLASASGPT